MQPPKYTRSSKRPMMPVGARPPPLSTRPMMPQKNSTSTVSQPNQLNQFIPPTTNHQPIRQPSSMPPTTMGNRGPMYGRPPPPRTQMTSSSQPPQNRYQSILQQSPNQQNYHIQHTQQSTHSTKMHPSHPQTTTTTTTTKTTHVSTSPTPYGKQSFMPTAGGRPPSVIDGRGRGGPPPPSKRGYNGPPSATSNYKGPPTSAPPSTLSPPSGPPPPPPSHKGGRYPPSNAVSTPYNKSSNENNSINRPPTSLTKPRTSRPRKSSKDSRIDPRQIPRPNLPAKETTVDAMYATRTGKGLPPEDCGDYIVEDQGNTNPRILRMSMNSIPRSKDMVVASKIPFRGHVRPFAPLREEDTQVPCLDFGEDGPPRCGRCNGFINPYAKFENNGKTWRCNLCNVSNDVVDPSYECNLDAYGRRYDIDNRPELVHGCVDYVVPSKYMVRPPQEKIFVFAIDVSYSAISSGLTANSIASISYSMNYLKTTQAVNNQQISVGIMTYNDSLQFYDLRTFEEDREGPYVLYVTNVDEPFAAIPPSAWIVPLDSNSNGEIGIDKLNRLMSFIPNMYTSEEEEKDVRRRSSGMMSDVWSHGCSSAAIVAAKDSLSKTGGKIIIFQSSIPSRGAGMLKNRENGVLYGTKDEPTMYHPRHQDPKHINTLLSESKNNSSNSSSSSPSYSKKSSNISIGGVTSTLVGMNFDFQNTTDFYVALAKECTELQVSVDQFICSSGYTDIATLGQLSTKTGGRLCYYPGFSITCISDCERMKSDVLNIMTNIKAYEVAMKVRVSEGLSVGGIHGLGLETSTITQRDIPCLNEDSSFNIILEYNNDLPEESSDAYIQVSFLHTDMNKRRIVRVINYAMPVVTSLSAVFRYADVHCVCNSLLREYSSMTQKKSLEDIRKQMSGLCVDILYAYRQHCASNHSSGQLILPESLKFLPLFTLSMGRSAWLLSNDSQNKSMIEVTADLRAYKMCQLQSMPVPLSIPVVYPRLLSLHDMPEGCGDLVEFETTGDGTQKHKRVLCKLPKYKWPSVDHVTDESILLLDAGTDVYLWVGALVSSEIIQDLFNVTELSADAAVLRPMVVERRGNELSTRVMNVIDEHFRRHRVSTCQTHIHVVKQGSSIESDFLSLLVEDSNTHGQSYVEHLCEVHRQIQTKMNNSGY